MNTPIHLQVILIFICMGISGIGVFCLAAGIRMAIWIVNGGIL